MVFIKGDVHRNFAGFLEFFEDVEPNPEDTFIILGDVGINYYLDSSDHQLKKRLSKNFPITFLFIAGNHEERPFNISTYKEKEWNGGMIYYEEEFPNLLFAKDGEIYELDGKKYFVCGGAYSVDKHYRLTKGWSWFPDEQPNDEAKTRALENLEKVNWKVDYVLTHTCPLKYVPRETFLSSVDQSTVDTSTEEFLDKIEDKLEYENWFCGHYHIEKNIDKIKFLMFDVHKIGEGTVFHMKDPNFLTSK